MSGDVHVRICEHLGGRFPGVTRLRIIADTRNMVNRTMLSVVETLRGYGLSLNGGKTRIIEPGTEEHQKFIDNQDFEAKKLDSMLNSGKKRFVLESFSEIYRGTIDYLEKNKIHERKFRFYANRLVTFLNAKDIFIPKKFKDEISCKLIGGIDGRPDCADQICKLAQAVGPNKLLQKNLVDWVVNDDNLTFEWAVYSVIKTLAIQGCSSKKLRDYCLKVLKDPTSSEPIRGISAVFLNNRAYNAIIKQLSKSNSHFLQRHFLIALAFKKPEDLKKIRFGEFVIEEYRGLHKQIHRASKVSGFKLIRTSERLSQRVLIKELRSYA